MQIKVSLERYKRLFYELLAIVDIIIGRFINMLNNFYDGKWGSENRTDIALKCQTLQVNQKPEVAILHNNLYHINSDGINVNNLRCWSVRDIFTSSKNIFLSC